MRNCNPEFYVHNMKVTIVWAQPKLHRPPTQYSQFADGCTAMDIYTKVVLSHLQISCVFTAKIGLSCSCV